MPEGQRQEIPAAATTALARDAPDPATDTQRTFRLEAALIITVDDDNRVLTEHSLVIENGIVTACLPWADAERLYPAIPAVDRRKGILLPGLINAHTHLAMNLLRGIADDLPLETWLENHIWPAESRHVSREFVRDGTDLALAECLLNGVTTVNDMYFFPDVVATRCREAGLRAMVGLLVFDFPTVWANSVDEYFARGLALHDALRNDPLISTAFAPHAPYTVSKEPLERIAMLSSELDIPVHMHVHETENEVEQFRKRHGVRPFQRLDEIGLLGPSMLAVHLTQLTDTEIARLVATGVNVVHCPESNLKLASGICRISDLLKAGANIAIGTDGAASNNDLDLLGELRTAALLAKISSKDAATLPAARALRMITIDAAKALGLGDVVGSLEPGKFADCIVIEPDLGMIPMYDALSQLIYANSSPCVNDVWVAGRQLLENRQLTTLDAQHLRCRAKHWFDLISQR